MNDQSIGIMEGAFFVPKGQILTWINQVLGLNLTRIEQLGTGAVYCQLLDLVSPGKIKLSKVNWKARNEWQFLDNLKLLQNAFQKCGIKKHIQVEKLAKAKYQDNLEFSQWFKRFYDLNPPKSGYNAASRRNNVDPDLSFLEHRGSRGYRQYREHMSSSKSPKRQLKLRNFSIQRVGARKADQAIGEIAQVLRSQLVDSEKIKRINELIAERRTAREVQKTEES